MFVPDLVHLQSMSGWTGLGTYMTHEASGRNVLGFNVGFGGLPGDGGVVDTGETSPPTVGFPLQMSFNCSINLSQAPGHKNYK